MATDTHGRRINDAQRTRRAISEGLLNLLQEGQRRPTADAIAERAGVSRRSVFVHFADLDELYTEVAVVQGERLVTLMKPIAADLPLAERIDQFLAQRQRIYETMTPIRRSALGAAPFSRTLADIIDRCDAWLRDQIAEVFATELAGREPRVLAALDAAVSWASWFHLRRLSRAEVRRCLRCVIEALLAHRSDPA